MKNPLIINIRCTCIEEYVRMLDLHEQFRKQRSEGEILSIYVGATPAMYGKSPLLDKMLDKVFGDGAKPIPTERIVREKVVGAQGNGDGTVTETVERTFVPEAEPEVAFDPNAEDYRAESRDWKVREEPKPEITLTDVLTSMAEEPDPMEAIKTEAEGEPDGADWSTYAG